MSNKITVQFWGDLICPMTPIAYVNLKQAIKLFPHKDNVDIIYRSFRIRPGVAPHTVDTYLKKNHGEDTNVASILTEVEQWGAAAGLTYKMANTLAGDTMDAHRVVHFARTEGLQMKAVERIQKAHFAEEQTIFDTNTLLRLAEEIGLNRNAVDLMLTGNAFKKDVEADQEALQQMGVSGIPYFLVNNLIPIRGLQNTETFLAALNRAWEAQNLKVSAIHSDDASYSTDICVF